MTEPHQHNQPPVERQTLQADILCVGFGPATGGFLTTVTKGLVKEDGSPAFESRVNPGSPLQVLCYERADDLGYGVSGVVTRGRSLKASFPGEEFRPDSLSSPRSRAKRSFTSWTPTGPAAGPSWSGWPTPSLSYCPG